MEIKGFQVLDEILNSAILDEITINNIIKIDYNQNILTHNFEVVVKFLRSLGLGYTNLK